MANPEHVELVRSGREAVAAWREVNRGVALDLAGVELSGIELVGMNLEGSNLNGATLREVNLDGTNFSFASLRSATFVLAEGKFTRFERARMQFASLVGVRFENATLEFADCRNLNAVGASFVRVNARYADFTMSTLHSATLHDVRLRGADMSYVNLSNANLKNIDATDVRYDRSWDALRSGGADVSELRGNALFRRDLEDADWLSSWRFFYRNQIADRGPGTGERTNVPPEIAPFHNHEVVYAREQEPGPRRLLIRMLHRVRQFQYWLWRLSTDCGRSLARVAVFGLTQAVLFGAVYVCNPDLVGFASGIERETSWFTYYYYSIVTFTTLGFGDITPKNMAGEIIVTLEVILGYLTLGLLVAILAQKVARRS